MMDCGRTWQPEKLLRVVEALPNSTKPLHVVTDRGEAIMKAMGNPMGPEALAFELVGTELARWFGLKTPDFALMPLRDVPREWSPHFAIENGPAFLSGYLRAATYDGQGAFLGKLARPEDIARLVVFDTWIRNEDRCPPEASLDDKPANLDNLMFARSRESGGSLKYDLIVFDHTHAFSNAGYEGLEDEALIEADGVYGFFPAFRPYMTQAAIKAATDRLGQVDEGQVQSLLDAVPPDWGVTARLKHSWRNLIFRRARYVAGTIEDKIIYQREMWEGGKDVG
ncbi:HipA family kinase [Asticcacaulis sp.]|uniref:HipA family kinase n=1 Tax=Asticcacaulis sp. TaxID=1872648 RepID=UPI003F7B519A